jgi:Myo-inositol oxygenase
MSLIRSLPRPIKGFVRRKLNQHGFYHVRDGMGLNEHGFYDIRGVGEITTIDEFKQRAFAICRRSRLQTQKDVIALKKKYEEPIFGEIAVERLLELQAQIIDPTNTLMFTGSQLTHTLQVLESMEKAGITDREFLATTLIHDLGKLASLKGWVLKWHSIQTDCEPLMDARDRALFEKYYKPFVRHDRTFIFHHLPKKRLTDYLPLVKEFFPEKVLF